MRSDWKQRRLSEVMDVMHGFAFPGDGIRDEPSDYVLVTPGNFSIGGGFKADKFKYFDGEVPPEYVFKDGDLIVTMTDLSKHSDTLGYSALVPAPNGKQSFLHNQRVGKVVIKPEAEVDKRFLYYLLQTDEYRHEVLASATGTSIKHTSPSRILAFRANFPPLSEQRAIALILGTLDDKIELNRQMNATLEAMARALFQSWFVEFNPIRAKAAGQSPAGMDKATADLFPAEFEVSELGDIPKGWKNGTLGDLVTFARESVTPANCPEELFQHYSLPSFDEGRLPKAELGSAIKSNKFLVPSDAVLLSKLNPRIQRIWAPFIQTGSRALASTEFLVTRPKHDYSREYLYCLFTSEQFGQEYQGLVSGTTGSHQRVDAKSAQALDVTSPAVQVVRRFTEAVRPMLLRVNANIAESHTLAALRDALLPKLLSRELLTQRKAAL